MGQVLHLDRVEIFGQTLRLEHRARTIVAPKPKSLEFGRSEQNPAPAAPEAKGLTLGDAALDILDIFLLAPGYGG